MTTIRSDGTIIIGVPGAQGIPGEGVPTGGTTGQILYKASGDDYDTGWETLITSIVPEGSRLYFTDERAQDAVGGILNSTLVYDDNAPSIGRAAITGDVSVPLGSNAATLATVNSNIGVFGDALNIPQVTVNGKGLITAITSNVIAGLTVSNFASPNVSQWTNDAGYITSAALTGLVPYTGATNDVNLGVHSLTGYGLIDTRSRVFNVLNYGADPTGVADSSAAIQSALNAANTTYQGAISPGLYITTGTLYFPAGSYRIDTGLTVTNLNLNITTDGKECTRLVLGAGQVFITASAVIYQFDCVNGFTTAGGAGFLNHTRTAANVQGMLHIAGNAFYGYTGVAIGTLSSDFPYIRIYDNVFRGSNALTSKGVVINGDNAGSLIQGNAFERNLYDLQILSNQRVTIKDNDFTRFTNGGGSPALTSVWLIPRPPGGGITGNGILFEGNNFGNENNNAVDYKILYADLGVGTNALDQVHSTSVSTSAVTGITYRDNNFDISGAPNNGVIYSYAIRVRNHIFDSRIFGTAPYIFHFDSAITDTDSQNNNSNIVYINTAYSLGEQVFPQISNLPGMALVVDRFGITQGTESYIPQYNAASAISYKDILTNQLISAFTLTNASTTPITDANNGTNAATITFGGSNGVVFQSLDMTKVDVNRIAWITFTVKKSSVTPLTSYQFLIRDNSGNNAAQRTLRITDEWSEVRIPWVPSQNGTQLYYRFQPIGYSSGIATNIDIGLPYCYHAEEPVNRTTLLDNTKIFVGNSANIAAPVSISGDAALANTGALTVSKINGKSISLANSFTTSGDFALTLTQTGATSVTLPTSGTLLSTTSSAESFPTLNQNTTGSAATLTTPRAIYGNNFNGSSALTQVIASTYGGTGNGFTKFSGATTSEKTYTLPDASCSILTTNTVVTAAQGGTGVANNAASTITISGNFGTTFTISGTTSVTLPTSGTLATRAGTETFTNKTITGTVNAQTGTTYTLLAADFQGKITANNSSPQTYTLPQQSTLTTAAGVSCWIENIGSGTVTLVKEGSETLLGNTTLAPGATAYIYRDTTTTWSVFGGTSIVTMPGINLNINITTSQTITLVGYAGCAMTILGLYQKARSVGTAGTFAIKINGVDITGLNAIAPSTGGGYTSASGANIVARGDQITIVADGTLVSIADLALSLDYTMQF